jgi:hypothetical protein
MSVQPASLSLASLQNFYSYSAINSTKSDSNTNTGSLANDQQSSNTPSVQTMLLSEQYSSDSLLLKYTNNDGDTLSLSAQSINYQNEIQAANNDTTTDDSWKKIIADIKDQYAQMKADLINQLFGNGQDDTQKSTQLQDPRSFDETKAIPGLPDYWNAENTSQRIVDFATSFLSAFKGSGSDFLSMIKDAIDKGFSEAKDMFGDVPNAVSQLTDKTHALVMDKLDAWAKAQGITTDSSQDQTDTAASSVQAA